MCCCASARATRFARYVAVTRSATRYGIENASVRARRAFPNGTPSVNARPLRHQVETEVFRDVDLGRGKSADQIQSGILAAYRAHGVEPRSDFSRVARFLAAGSAQRGTRTLRLLQELGSGVRALGRWADEQGRGR
jgi:hypothetical protein